MLSLATVCVKSPGSSVYSRTDQRAGSNHQAAPTRSKAIRSQFRIGPFPCLTCPLLYCLLTPESCFSPPTTYHIPSLVSRTKAPESQEQECRGGRDPALRDAGGHAMKMLEAAKMPQPRHAEFLPQPQAASACRRHHKEAVKISDRFVSGEMGVDSEMLV